MTKSYLPSQKKTINLILPQEKSKVFLHSSSLKVYLLFNSIFLTFLFMPLTDLEENRKILKEFQEVINNGSKRLLIADVEGARSTQYYDLADIIQNVGLITKVNRSGMTLSQGVKNTVVEYIDAVPAGKVPNWLIGNIGIARVGSRLGHDVRNAMNVLQMTLPGIVTTYYGEEIGMLNGVSEKTPMQWSDESNAGRWPCMLLHFRLLMQT